ncbi:hypothetical protein I4U23_000506 [Adineta vaga]|nr:hypothetical protein I4U23_000506 [Adineta vaga]
MNETRFWLNLSTDIEKQDIPNVSIIPNQSIFVKRVHKHDFDFHQLPARSILKLCEGKIHRHFTSTLVHSDGPGGIFPLASSLHRLFTFNYHHEGAIRYWYILPSKERERLKTILNQQKTSTCFQHENILINPDLLDKYQISYQRVVQNPHEILILSAGSLHQSFTEDYMCSESIDFALPSWIQDRHAFSHEICSCNLPRNSSINLNIMNNFNHKLLQRYIDDYLNQDDLNNKNDEMMTTNQICDINRLHSIPSNSSTNDIVSSTTNVYDQSIHDAILFAEQFAESYNRIMHQT